MRRAYRITGSSFEKPENLPEGFTVKERLVGEEIQTSNGVAVMEVKDGTAVLYHKNVSHSNVKLSRLDMYRLMIFFNKVINQHYRAGEFDGN